ncbi:MAG: cyanophycinase [Bacteroidota bacterium]
MKVATTILRITLITLFLTTIFNQMTIGQDIQFDYKLVIAGGGQLPDTIFKEFRRLAGSRGNLVVIPTASSREVEVEKVKELWKSRGFQDVSILHTHDREVALSKGFSDPLKTATAVWFSGGSQHRIADAYLGTPVEEELYNLVQRGGVIGGSSAGAAIQSKVMIRGGDDQPKISTGFDLIQDAIIDQHFLRRNRISRLIGAIMVHSAMTGYGIDEGTAIVAINGKYKVIGKSYVIRVRIVEGEIRIDSFEDGDIINNTDN